MLRDSFLFELKYRLKSPGTWLCLLGLVFMTYREMLAGEWDLLIQSGRVARNSPYTVYYLFMYYTFWVATIGGALVIPTLLRDLKSGTAELLYSFPLQSKRYFVGKYLAMMMILIMVMSSVAIGFITLPFISSFLGIHPTTDFVDTPWLHIGHAFLLWVIPACFIYGSIIFAATALTGREGPAYVIIMLAVGLFVIITAIYGDGAPHSRLVQIIDPLGKVTVEGQIYYWTAQERMENFLLFEGELLQNRLLYIAISALLLIISWIKFDVFKLWQLHKNTKRKKESQLNKNQGVFLQNAKAQPLSTSLIVASTYSYWLRCSFYLGWQVFVNTVRSKALYLSMLTLILMLMLAGWSYTPVDFEGTGKLYPKAFIIMPGLMYPSLLFTLIAAAFFSIEICNRENTYRVQQLVDTTPIPTWSVMLSKSIGAILLAIALSGIPIITILLIQYGKGFYDSNWTVILHISFLVILPMMLMYIFISIICYGFLKNKALSQGVAIILCITPAIFNEVRTIENYMFLWAWPFPVQLSDFSASSQFFQRDTSFATYWLSLYFSLAVLAYWLWPRGTNTSFKHRLIQINIHRKPISFCLLIAFASVFAWSSNHIYSSMIVRNQYQTNDEKHREQADYEKKYAHIRNTPQPKIKTANVSIDLYPKERKAYYVARLELSNKTEESINRLYINYPEFATIKTFSLQENTITPAYHDTVHRQVALDLPSRLEENDVITLELTLQVAYEGFRNDEYGYHGSIVADGSYFPQSLWPSLGYDRKKELKSAGLRNQYGLGDRQPLPNSVSNPNITDFSRSDDADFLDSQQVSITTDSDHKAIAPGELTNIDVDTVNQRQTYHYQTQTLSLWDIHLSSGRYQLVKEQWQPNNGGPSVDIEIYHHAKHDYNIDKFITAAKQALDSASLLWGEFPYSVVRVVETPKDLSESHVSNNVIFIPEDHGWIHDYRENPEFDWITFQIARDIHRIWWQQIPVANLQGKSLFEHAIPSLYALNALESQSTHSSSQLFIERISSDYLRDRTTEDKKEKPFTKLADEEYASSKSILTLYSIYKLVGDKEFNEVLSHYFKEYKHKTQLPYANVNEVLQKLIKKIENDFVSRQINLLSEQTFHYDFHIEKIQLISTTDNIHKLYIDLSADQFNYQDGLDSKERYNGMAELWILSDDDEQSMLYNSEIKFNQGVAKFSREFDKKPLKAIINPRYSLLEKSPNDNSFYIN